MVVEGGVEVKVEVHPEAYLLRDLFQDCSHIRMDSLEPPGSGLECLQLSVVEESLT